MLFWQRVPPKFTGLSWCPWGKRLPFGRPRLEAHPYGQYCHETSLTSPIARPSDTIANCIEPFLSCEAPLKLLILETQGSPERILNPRRTCRSAHLWSPSQITGSSWNDPAEEWVGKSYSSTLNSSLKNSLGSHMGMGKTSIFRPGIACSCPQIISFHGSWPISMVKLITPTKMDSFHFQNEQPIAGYLNGLTHAQLIKVWKRRDHQFYTSPSVTSGVIKAPSIDHHNKVIRRFPEMEVPLNHQKLDHNLVLKPMVTWRSQHRSLMVVVQPPALPKSVACRQVSPRIWCSRPVPSQNRARPWDTVEIKA